MSKKINIWPWLMFSLALFLRIYCIGKSSFWSDEANNLWIVQLGIKNINAFLYNNDNHPPLFFYFLWNWISALKLLNLPLTEVYLRIPFALFSAIQVLIIYQLAKTAWNQKIAIIAAFCLAISASHIIMGGGEVKMYSMFGLFAMLSIFFLYRWLYEGKSKHIIGYVIFTILALYTHYLAFIFLLAQELYLIFFLKRISIKNYLIVQLLIILGILPLLPNIIHHLASHKNIIMETPGTWRSFLDTLLIYYHGYPLQISPWSFIYFALLLLIFLTICCGIKKSNEPFYPEILLALVTFLPLGIMIGRSCMPPYIMYSVRHLIFILPFFLLLWIRPYPTIPTKLLLIIFIACNLFSLFRWYYNPDYQKARWREVVLILQQKASLSDAIILQNPYQFLVFKHYYKNNLPIYLFDQHTSAQDLIYILRNYRHIWFISCYGWMVDPQLKIAKWLGEHYKPNKVTVLKNCLDPKGNSVVIDFQKNK